MSESNPQQQEQERPTPEKHHLRPLPPGLLSPAQFSQKIDSLPRAYFPSQSFILSCGALTYDILRGRVLLVLNHKYDIFQLPKGRKNIDEPLPSAAVRETFEETGYMPKLLRIKIPTRATPKDDGDGEAEEAEVTEDMENTEPVACCHYPDPYSGALKMVFFFLAEGNSEDVQKEGTQTEWERLEAKWVGVDEAKGMLRFEEDGMVVERGLEVLRANGYAI